MKRIGLTQRVDIIASYGERRDALDQRWYDLLLELGMLPIPLPNLSPQNATYFIDKLEIDGIILTGGNSISVSEKVGHDNAPERDIFEITIIDYAINNNLPVLGICRGMQVINHYFGGTLKEIDGHIAKRHVINTMTDDFELPKIVNSFHSLGIAHENLGLGLKPIAVDEKGNIEAFLYPDKNILGVMWHPEREENYSKFDLNLIKGLFL
ncbi:type 1 glutamine amidotransferase [Vibrio coralliirubri]|uniref:type 1 glutamine amidotransferase n=1 Tax=Vibrio coralliirubri TaxID=1516159 RepID=UPI000EFA4EAB|nr:type 1 glutamine amidotransferase [Vibrio coralliirubri]